MSGTSTLVSGRRTDVNRRRIIGKASTGCGPASGGLDGREPGKADMRAFLPRDQSLSLAGKIPIRHGKFKVTWKLTECETTAPVVLFAKNFSLSCRVDA
jgi:hypothetical protein